MSSFATVLIIVGVVLASFVIAFSEEIKTAAVEILSGATDNDTPHLSPAEKPGQISAPERKWVPDGFRGPTEKPRIIGPKENPPSY